MCHLNSTELIETKIKVFTQFYDTFTSLIITYCFSNLYLFYLGLFNNVLNIFFLYLGKIEKY